MKSRISAAGNALVMTLIMTAVALILLAGILSWSTGTARLAARSNQYTRAVAAAEAATEKVNSRLSSDFLSGGEALVIANLNSYRQIVPTASDSSYWSDWQFSDAQGNTGRTFVQQGSSSNYTVLSGAYAGLNGYASTYTLVSDACESNNLQEVVAGVLEDIQLTRIPIFQFAMYSSGEMEVSCGQPFTVDGPVHSNGQLYVEPDSLLTFQSGVTAVGSILFQRDPLDTRGPLAGAVTYDVPPLSGQPALTLPIGTSNSPEAIRQIIEPPMAGETASSAIGMESYYYQVDLLITVMNTNISVTSGNYNGFGTHLLTNEVSSFVQTNHSFTDWRENKTVHPIDINVGAFVAWSTSSTNTNSMTIRSALGRNIWSIYVYDERTLSGPNLGAVRLTNGLQLPPLGLTVATGDPLYIQGHYNQPVSANLGTANVSTTLPASVAADAVTILSTAWTDGNSMALETSRGAAPTTVNAAILAGEMNTTLGQYSGGMENFPRFMEDWGSNNVFTYNGSMVKMFPSIYATNVWGQTNVYNPPARHWTYDTNFNNPVLLPPLTPSLQVVSRSQWATLAPNTTSAP